MVGMCGVALVEVIPRSLVDSNRLIMVGTGRWARYRLPRQISVATHGVSWRFTVLPVLSRAGAEIREYVRQPRVERNPVVAPFENGTHQQRFSFSEHPYPWVMG